MKAYKIKTLLFSCILAGTSLTSCTDLEEVWYSEVTPSTFYTSKENVYSALYRPFTHARWFVGESRWRLQEFTTDAMIITTKGPHWYNGGENERYHYHNWTVNDGWIWDTWRGATMGVALALDTKQDLEKLDYTKLGLTQADKDAHINQLNTLVGYFYLRALDFFGGMPIFTSNEGENIPRSTDLETFTHVETVFKEAIPLLEKKTADQTEEGALKQGAAAIMLAQLYFNANPYIGQEKYVECAQICQDIIDGKYGAYSLDPTWYGPHSFENNQSPEVIWCNPSQNAKLHYNWFWSQFYHYETYKYLDLEGGADNGAHLQPSRKPTGELYDFKLGKPFAKFNDKDLRKKPYFYQGGGKYEGMFLVGEQTNPRTGVSSLGTQEYKGQIINFVDMVGRFKEVGDEFNTVADLPSKMSEGEENTGIRLMKVPQPNIADKTIRWNADNPVFRLSEVYYMLAECKMRAGDKQGAANLINTVRKRNFEGGVDPDPVTATNLDEYRILDEWLVEFLGEGQGRRRSDLIRWNKFVTEPWWDHAPKNSTHLNRFPVPANAISGSNVLVQNPGYE